VRGGWLAAEGKAIWLFEATDSVWLGALYGLLYALAGFAVAFAVMFLIWIFGSCGGGDVKLMSSVAAWLGIGGFLFSWLGSVVVLFFWMAARLIAGGLTPRQVKRSMAKLQEQRKAPAHAKPGTRMTYSLPLAIAVTAVLLGVYWGELQLPKLQQQQDQPQGVSAHDRSTSHPT
jgi:Flp pilus assembly protein protease CpaA